VPSTALIVVKARLWVVVGVQQSVGCIKGDCGLAIDNRQRGAAEIGLVCGQVLDRLKLSPVAFVLAVGGITADVLEQVVLGIDKADGRKAIYFQ
jgi:hypothetical protein